MCTLASKMFGSYFLNSCFQLSRVAVLARMWGAFFFSVFHGIWVWSDYVNAPIWLCRYLHLLINLFILAFKCWMADGSEARRWLLQGFH